MATQNCIVNRLDASLSTDFLKPDELRITVLEALTMGLAASAANHCTLSVLSGSGRINYYKYDTDETPLLDNESTVDIASGSYRIEITGPCVLSITNKYAISMIQVAAGHNLKHEPVPLRSLTWCHALNNIRFISGGTEGDLSELPANSGLNHLLLGASTLTGSIGYLARYAELKSILIFYSGGVAGDIAGIGSLLHLRKLDIRGLRGITGSLESLFDAMSAAGRGKAGTADEDLKLEVVAAGSGVTWRESPVTSGTAITVKFNAIGWYVIETTPAS